MEPEAASVEVVVGAVDWPCCDAGWALACVLVLAEAMASCFVPADAYFGGLGVSPCLRAGESLVERPLAAGCYRGVSANEGHLLEVAVPVSPSHRVV